MDLDYALKWLVGISALMGVRSLWRRRELAAQGWFWVNAVVLLVVVLGTLFGFDGVGYAGAVAWAVLVGIPSFAARHAQRAGVSHDLQRAASWWKIAGLLHPWDGLRQMSLYLQYEAEVDRGRRVRAERLLDKLAESPEWRQRAELERLRLDERWDAIAAHERGRPHGQRDLRLAQLYLRAYGELGAIDDLWRVHGALPNVVAWQVPLCLRMAAMTGLVECVDTLCARHLQTAPEGVQVGWRATALQARGAHAEASQILSAIVAQTKDAIGLAKRRLERPLAAVNLEALHPETRDAVARFERRVQAEPIALGDVGSEAKRPTVTLALGAVLIVVFALSVPGGTTNLENLVHMGALVLPPELVGGSVWWRIFAAGFLHFGATHLSMNLLGLWFLGRALERYGGASLLVVFLGSSIGAFSLVTVLSSATPEHPMVIVGASAGVMGVLGALASITAVGHRLRQHPTAPGLLRRIGIVVLLQSTFDWVTPQVSGASHLAGLACGAVLGVPLGVWYWKRKR